MGNALKRPKEKRTSKIEAVAPPLETSLETSIEASRSDRDSQDESCQNESCSFEYYNQLPVDIQKIIISYLNYIELIESRVVDKHWNMLVLHRIDTMPSSYVFKDLIVVRHLGPSPGVAPYIGRIATDLLQDYAKRRVAQTSKEYKTLKNYQFSQWERPFVTTFALHSRILDREYIASRRVKSANVDSIVAIYEKNLHRLMTKLQSKFCEKFIQERVRLFNVVYNCNIHPNCMPLARIDDIEIPDSDKCSRIYCRFTVRIPRNTHSDRSPNSSGSEGYSEGEDSNPDKPKESRWHLIDPQWEIDTTEETVSKWGLYCEHLRDNQADVMQWFEKFSEELMGLHQFVNEKPLEILKKSGIHGETLSFLGNPSSDVFGFILYKTQKFLDKHNLHWKTFSWLPSDIDKIMHLMCTRKTVNIRTNLFTECDP